MTTFQIIMVVLMSIGIAIAIGFSIAFVIEAMKAPKEPVVEAEPEAKESEPAEEYDIREMLAQLDEEAKEAPAEEKVEETKEEVKEEPAAEEVKEEVVENAEAEKVEEAPVEEKVEEAPAEEKVEETKEEVKEEPAAEKVEEAPKTIIIKEVTTETVGTDFDYNVRLAKIVESKDKLEKDLQKTRHSILKYERTERRRARNQKMLDRRAVELTNLNLMMYSVTDIKNIDEDKKVKQEELTTHIAELKASIQDADEYLAKNREKYEHDKKMLAFYEKEEARYNDEIAELEVLIKNANSVTGSTTTTTTTTV